MKLSDTALITLRQYLQEDYPDMEITDDLLQEIAVNLVRATVILFGKK